MSEPRPQNYVIQIVFQIKWMEKQQLCLEVLNLLSLFKTKF